MDKQASKQPHTQNMAKISIKNKMKNLIQEDKRQTPKYILWPKISGLILHAISFPNLNAILSLSLAVSLLKIHMFWTQKIIIILNHGKKKKKKKKTHHHK